MSLSYKDNKVKSPKPRDQYHKKVLSNRNENSAEFEHSTMINKEQRQFIEKVSKHPPNVTKANSTPGSAVGKPTQQSPIYPNSQPILIKKEQHHEHPKDFNLEYAQLIARQFPIHDASGSLIDYSNINEFQLELLALHEEYGEEKDINQKRKIFHRL